MSSASDIAAGSATALSFVVVFAIVFYRLLSGRFLVPKREIVLPNQRGVVVQGDQVVRVAEPGTCWVRPKQTVVRIDMRSRPLQMAGLEVLAGDNGIVRLSLSAEYRVSDPAEYYRNSTNAGDAMFVQMRRVLNVAARGQSALAIASAPQGFAAQVTREMKEPAQRLGYELTSLDLYEAVVLGTLRVAPEAAIPFPNTGLVH